MNDTNTNTALNNWQDRNVNPIELAWFIDGLLKLDANGQSLVCRTSNALVAAGKRSNSGDIANEILSSYERANGIADKASRDEALRQIKVERVIATR
jgi:hypothetical protein